MVSLLIRSSLCLPACEKRQQVGGVWSSFSRDLAVLGAALEGGLVSPAPGIRHPAPVCAELMLALPGVTDSLVPGKPACSSAP